MFIKMESSERKQLIEILSNIPELDSPKGCKQILQLAGLDEFIYRIDFSGSVNQFIYNIIDVLCKYGFINDYESAIGRLLITVKQCNYTGNDQQQFIDNLLEKYQRKEIYINTIVENQSSQQELSQKIYIPENNQSLKQQNNKYTQLESCLNEKKWKEADEETLKIVLRLASTQIDKQFLTEEDINNLRDESAKQKLIEINNLWAKYSNKHFGFNTQKQIYLSSEKDFNAFSYKVGWRKKSGIFGGLFNWKSYEDLDFKLSADKGHLPFLVYRDTIVSSIGSKLGTLSDKLFLLCLQDIIF